MYPMEGVTMVRTWLIVISEGDTPMICEVSTPKITGFKSVNKNHPGNLKISQVFEIIQKILNWLIFSLLGPGAYGKSLSGEGCLVEASCGVYLQGCVAQRHIAICGQGPCQRRRASHR